MDIYLANPRGFCAGVRRAIDIVQKALQEYGAPIYVRHEIVHNKHVVENLKDQGVIFIEDIAEADKNRPLVFSAHGVAEDVKKQALEMGLNIIDATCPLVLYVHKCIKKLEKDNAEIIVIGKKSHAEIIGTVGQVKNMNRVHIVANLSEARNLNFSENVKIGLVTQTTLSTDETKEITDFLKQKYPQIVLYNNICFATTNRQKAVKKLAEKTENILVIGSKNSSNSNKLKEVALSCGIKNAMLIDDVSEINRDVSDSFDKIGITAGASAPEYLIEELIKEFEKRYDNINIHNVIVAEENIDF